MPADLRSSVESSFDKAFNDVFRNLLLHAVQDFVEQQVSLTLTQYADQVHSCEGHVISARKTIHEECVSVNEKLRKFQDVVAQNAKESARLQQGFAQAESESKHAHAQRAALEKGKQKLKADRSQLHSEEVKLNGSLVELRDEKKQVLHWQQLLAQMEQGLVAREAQGEVSGGSPRRGGVPLAVPAAADSLEQAQRMVERKAPVIEEYHQSRLAPRSGSPMPIKMYGVGSSVKDIGGLAHRPRSPLRHAVVLSGTSPLQERPGWN